VDGSLEDKVGPRPVVDGDDLEEAPDVAVRVLLVVLRVKPLLKLAISRQKVLGNVEKAWKERRTSEKSAENKMVGGLGETKTVLW